MEKLIVIKLGSHVLMKDSCLDGVVIENVVQNVADLQSEGYKVIIVSSGAIAAGQQYLNKKSAEGVEKVLFEQVCSSVGQPLLMYKYIHAFAGYGVKAAQALFTQESFQIQKMKDSLFSVIHSLLDLGIVPIVNENDVLAKEEIVFTDNDMLAAYVADFLGAELLLILTNVDGLLDAHPEEGGKLISSVSEIDENIYSMVSEKKSLHGRGGMKSKIDTAAFLLKRGVSVHIANGKKKDIVKRVLKGEKLGTLFCAHTPQ